MPDPYKEIGALLPMLGSADDLQVGRALDHMDAVLARHKLTWEEIGRKLSTLNKAAVPVMPSRLPNGERAPSQWKLDRDDVLKAYEHRSRLDDWAGQFIESVHEWCVANQRSLTAAQRQKLHEQLDKLAL